MQILNHNHDGKPLFRGPQIREGLTICIVFESDGRRHVTKTVAYTKSKENEMF